MALQKELTMLNTKDLRYEYAKAIGIILVVYGHVARGVNSSGMITDKTSFQLIDNIIYSFHMPLFFFISGLFFQHSLQKRGKTGLLLNKIDTIIYPYIIWSLVQGGFELIMSQFTNTTVSPAEILSFLWAPRAQFWFLYVLFLVFVLAVFILSKRSPLVSASVFIAASIANLLTDTIPNVFIVRYITHYFAFFSFGVLAGHYTGIISKYIIPSTITIALLTLGLQYLAHGVFNSKGSGLLNIAVALASILFVITISEWMVKIRWLNWFAICGSLSLHIYLTHILVGSGVRIILQKFFHIDNAIVHISAGCLTSIMFPVLLFYYVGWTKKIGLFSPPSLVSCQKLFTANR